MFSTEVERHPRELDHSHSEDMSEVNVFMLSSASSSPCSLGFLQQENCGGLGGQGADTHSPLRGCSCDRSREKC